MTALVTRYRSTTSAFAVERNVVMALGLGTPTAADIAALPEIVRDVARTTGGRAGMLLVLDGLARPPQGDARQQISAALKAMSPHVSGFAVAIIAEGFTSAALRSVMAAMMMAARADFQTRTFDDLGAALQWLHGGLQNKVAAGDIEATATAIRQALREFRAEGVQL